MPKGVARALLRLYPRAWRERYGEEVLATGPGIPLPDRRILGLTQYLGVAAVGRALIGSRIRLLALGPTEIAGWMTAALLSAVLLQMPWTPHAYWTWMLGEVHTGRGAAFNAIFGTYLVVISMPAASRAPRERRARMVQP